MSTNTLIFVLATAINFSLLLLLWIQRRKDFKNPVVISFTGAILFFMLWFVPNYLADISTSPGDALFWARMTVPFSLLALWFIFWFSFIFPTKISNYKIPLAVSLFLITITVYFALSDLVFVSVVLEPGIGITGMTLGKFYPFMIGTYLVLIFYTIFNLCVKYFKFYGADKNRIRYVLLGWGLFLVTSATVSLILPYILKDASVTKFGPLTSIFMVGFIFYAMAKHELMDIRVVIQRGLIFIFLLFIIVGVYASLLQILAYVLHKTIHMTAVISAGLTTILGVFFVRPLEDYFIKITDKFFFKDNYHYPDALHKLSRVLHTHLDGRDMMQDASELLKLIFKTDQARFRTSHMKDEDACFIPTISADVAFRGEQIGVLELGPKKSGDRYTNEDRQLLDTFAYQVAIALEKARLYEKVEEYNTGLEKIVEERTLEIKKLQEDQKQAMIDITHNLQTPLAVMKGELELFSDSPEMQNVKRSVTKVSQFITQLLKLAKLDHGAFNVNLATVNLSLLVKDQLEYFETMAEEKGVEIASEIEKKICISGNRKLLSELLANLVTNSIKYRRKDKNKSKIHIKLEKNNDYARLSVEDNGAGIKEEDLPEIFTRFYRGAQAKKAVGTGLGLAICRKIVERHGGEIRVESIPNERTVFIIDLPMHGRGLFC